MSDDAIRGHAFYAVLAWQKERGRKSLYYDHRAQRDRIDDHADVPPLDIVMEQLEQQFLLEVTR